MSGPSVHITHPPWSLLKLPPAAEPQSLSPPESDFTFARPFNIEPELYNSLLHVAIPITVAIVYASAVTYANQVNKRRDNKPWAFSKTAAFYCFVVLHNVFLAVYSGWTFAGMFNAIRYSWPGSEGEHGLAGIMDALCKVHGPRGLGSAATFNSTTSSWGFTDRALSLAGSSPDSTDVGRIWNEGLAFYGWLFYLSKFYEVVDTMVVLAKGKNSSTLQTYHHAGAMLSMWAGIRYMSPPIWMFVFVNSGLHTLMYTYYTLLTLAIPVPRAMKQTLTTLQIAQIVFGASYAMAHLFISYSIPVSVPYIFVHNLTSAIPAAVSSASSAVASVTATAGLGSWLKKLALRAAGEEGLAENVRNQQGEIFGIDAIHAAEVEKAQEEIRYKTQYQTIHCVDTSGQAFAILLNCLYLAPLLVLFVRFFLRAYIRGTRAPPPKPSQKQLIKDSSKDGYYRVEKEIKEAMDEEGTEDTDIPENVKAKWNDTKTTVQKSAEDLSAKAKIGMQKANDVAKEKASNIKGQIKKQEAKANGTQGQQNGQSKNSAKDSSQPEDKSNGESRRPSNKDTNKPSDQKDTKTSAQENNDLNGVAPKAEPKDEAEDQPAHNADPNSVKAEEKTESEEKAQPKAEETPDQKDEPESSQPSGGLDESAYEINPDEAKTEEEKKAEAEMQPGGT